MQKNIALIIFTGFALVALFLLSQTNIGSQPSPLPAGLILGKSFQIYKNEEHGFALEYPAHYKIEEFKEKDGAKTIVFQGNVGNQIADKEGFQIFITPFEEATLTKDRILKDIPGAILDDYQEIIIGAAVEESVRGLLFWSEDPLIGRTREVWFVHNQSLYEITAYAHMDELLSGIASTWRFD